MWAVGPCATAFPRHGDCTVPTSARRSSPRPCLAAPRAAAERLGMCEPDCPLAEDRRRRRRAGLQQGRTSAMRRPLVGAGAVAWLCIAVGGGGCGETVNRAPTGPRSGAISPGVEPTGHAGLSIDKKATQGRDVVACMHRNGMTVLSSGELETSTVVTAASLEAAESACRVRIAGPGRKKVDAASRRAEEITRASGHRVARFAACLRQHGVTVSLTAASSLLSGTRIRTRDSQVKTVTSLCRVDVLRLRQ
jgi:hypothetical protein